MAEGGADLNCVDLPEGEPEPLKEPGLQQAAAEGEHEVFLREGGYVWGVGGGEEVEGKREWEGG